ncbi:hypothetical protein D8674_026540 [Pyrus ussuriensis x Pyrus communis]|uniref:Uncharacterized protein n=1 Tax=Pyrus ussuriensis x Pyrus communis TaxID=2448454 RepID=A0A5N5I762_9ROSA|nr:hypothetical protein D8674_026540 [Pyrus ussuriensis x Pyrus communis]
MARVRSKEEGDTLAHSCQHFLIDAPLGGKLATTSKVPCLPLLTLNVHVPGFTLWYGADLGIQEFRMLYTMWKSVNPHSFFQSRVSVRWPAYISDLPRHDKYWYKDVLVVEGEWEALVDARAAEDGRDMVKTPEVLKTEKKLKANAWTEAELQSQTVKIYKVEATYKNELGNKTKIGKQLQGKKCGRHREESGCWQRKGNCAVRRADAGSGTEHMANFVISF